MMVLFWGVVAGAVTAALLWKPFFGTLDDFVECLGYWFTPDAWSFLRGDGIDDFWAEFKLGIWLILSVSVGWSVVHFLRG